MIGLIGGLVLGVFTIILGTKAFSEEGIPLSRTKNLTGGTAKAIGVACIGLGVLFVLGSLFLLLAMLAQVSG